MASQVPGRVLAALARTRRKYVPVGSRKKSIFSTVLAKATKTLSRAVLWRVAGSFPLSAAG